MERRHRTFVFFLKSFYRNFKSYGNFQEVGCLRQCIPTDYLKDIEQCFTLKSVLKSLYKWASDSQIHMEKLEHKLKNLTKSESFTGDKYILKQQLMIFQHCIEVNECFFLLIASIGIHVSKYSNGSNLYWTIMKKLDNLAGKYGDSWGRKKLHWSVHQNFKIDFKTDGQTYILLYGKHYVARIFPE